MMFRRGAWLVVLVLALSACTPPADPLAEAKRDCADASKETEAQIAACTTVIGSGALDDANRSIALANRGSALADSGDTPAAMRDFRAALELNSDNMHAVRGRAGILIESGQLDAAEPLIERLLASGEYTADAHFFAGNVALARSDMEAAIAAYDQAISVDSQHARALANRARAKQLNQDYAGAMSDYDAAIAANPQLAPAYAGRCWTRISRGDDETSAARADADAATRIDPASIDGQLCRGLLQLRAGEWAGAKESYDAVLALEPGNPDALFGRGVARRRSGDEAGLADMNQARDFSPNIDRSFNRLGVRTF